jgi:hypothetical protein
MSYVNPNASHGHATGKRSATYRSWESMKSRCENPHSDQYPRYGGRGIRVCERWQSSFEHFLADMGERPEGTTLDRFPNSNGNYEVSNCRWANAKDQARNRSSNVAITYEGRTQTMAAWCEEFGLSKALVHYRIKRGHSLDAVFSPAGNVRRLTA